MDFGREKGVFPLVLIQVKNAAKRTVFGLKNKREKTFLPFKAQLFHIQVVRYAASVSKHPFRLPGAAPALFYRQEVTPSVVPIAVRMVTNVWMTSFQIDFLSMFLFFN